MLSQYRNRAGPGGVQVSVQNSHDDPELCDRHHCFLFHQVHLRESHPSEELGRVPVRRQLPRRDDCPERGHRRTSPDQRNSAWSDRGSRSGRRSAADPDAGPREAQRARRPHQPPSQNQPRRPAAAAGRRLPTPGRISQPVTAAGTRQPPPVLLGNASGCRRRRCSCGGDRRPEQCRLGAGRTGPSAGHIRRRGSGGCRQG